MPTSQRVTDLSNSGAGGYLATGCAPCVTERIQVHKILPEPVMDVPYWAVAELCTEGSGVELFWLEGPARAGGVSPR